MSGEFSGSLGERVAIEQRRADRDVLAGAKRGYVYAGASWAAVAPLFPASLTEADALSALPRWQVTMRKREGVGPQTRLVWRSRFLAVRSVTSDPRAPEKMILTCEEIR
jgi:head-tail adaptor